MWHIELQLSAAHSVSFLLDRFSVRCRFPFPILRFFTVKSPGVTQRSASQENAFKKSKKPVGFSLQNYGLKEFFYSNWKQFQVTLR